MRPSAAGVAAEVRDWLSPRHAAGAAAWYVVLTLAWTWPLATSLTRDFPWDLGDSLLVSWILGWNLEHFLALVRGDWSFVAGWPHGNVFHPTRYTLGYSELLLTQSLAILPAYALSKNLILCYNLTFLSTFALSGLGMYLFVRQLTGDWRAGFIAGVLFAFTPYRVTQATHVQTLSIQWMPFVFYGLRRYFDTGRHRLLVGAGASLVAQNLSCGYWMVFLALYLPFYVVYEIVDRGLVCRWDVWARLGAVGFVALAITAPAMYPYVALREVEGFTRSLDEVRIYAADLWGYLTPDPLLPLWSQLLRGYPRGEGHLFPGLTVVVLAGVGLAHAARSTDLQGTSATWMSRVLWILFAAGLFFTAWILLGFSSWLVIGPVEIGLRSPRRPAAIALTSAVLLLCVSPRARRQLRGHPTSLAAFCVAAALAAAWLSLGPSPLSRGQPIQLGTPYAWLFEVVPGLAGLRVPARLAMFVVFFLAAASGYGARRIFTASKRPHAWLGLLCIVAVAESWVAPIPINDTWSEFLSAPPARVNPTHTPPAIYRAVQSLPPDAVIVEFPLGDGAWDLRAVYYSTTHWRRLLNGYSGGVPERYVALRRFLFPVPEDPRAWDVLLETGATHAIVHDLAYAVEQRAQMAAWLDAHGARRVATLGQDALYRLRSP
jgi:hypothetical protein